MSGFPNTKPEVVMETAINRKLSGAAALTELAGILSRFSNFRLRYKYLLSNSCNTISITSFT